jgi:hypothetical protein
VCSEHGTSTPPRNASPATAAHPASSGSSETAAPRQSTPAAARRDVVRARLGSGGWRGCGDAVRRARARSLVAAPERNGWRRPRRAPGAGGCGVAPPQSASVAGSAASVGRERERK